jgi:DNA-binding Lrp family transcriptional regulator
MIAWPKEPGYNVSALAGPIKLSVPGIDTRTGLGGTAAQAEPLASVDATDQKLISLLLADGRLGNRALAMETGISEATVAVRLRRLVADGVLVFTAIVDWEVAGYEWFAIAKINADGHSARDVAERIALLPECLAASVVFGSVDVLAYFLLEDRAALRALLDDELASIDGIAKVSLDLATESFVTTTGRNSFIARNMPALVLPRPRISLDGVDVGLIEALLTDGRRSSRQIGRDLGVSEGTIRTRMARLTNARLIKVVAMVNPLALGMVGAIAEVGLRVRRKAVNSLISELVKIPEVVFGATTVGTVDVSVAVAAPSRSDLLQIVLDRIRVIDGVQSTETLEMVDLVRFMPHMKRIN